MELETERRALAARWAVCSAGESTLRYFGRDVPIEIKADETPVTAADKEAEAMLREVFKKKFPGDGFLGEEYGREESRTGFTWIIDPIDATKNFVRGIPIFATLVGLEHEGEMVAGFCYEPTVSKLYHAVKGQGAFANDRQIRVSNIEKLPEAQIVYSSIEWFDKAGATEYFLDVVRSVGRTRGFGDYYGFTLVAEGGAEAMLEPGVSPWDIAALKPIIEEAGGVLTDWQGRSTIYSHGAIAGNPAVHRQLLERFKNRHP